MGLGEHAARWAVLAVHCGIKAFKLRSHLSWCFTLLHLFERDAHA